ncbi:MAG: hypothetical protein U0414_25210 [Polyangiaceae bacterium]
MESDAKPSKPGSSDPPEAGGPPRLLSFDEWARLSARCTKKGPAEASEILAAASVSEPHFQRSDKVHRASLDADLAEGKTQRAERYAALCADEADAARNAAIARERALARPLPTSGLREAPVDVGRVAIPSFMLEAQPVGGQLRSPGASSAAAPLGLAGAVLPRTPIAIVEAPVASRAETTLDLGDVALALEGDAKLPFVEAKSERHEAADPAEGAVASTRPPVASPANVAAVRVVAPASAAVGETVDLGDLSALDPAASRAVEPPASTRMEPVPISVSQPAAPARAEPVVERIEGLTLEQYAYLCVELSMYPKNPAPVLSRYGLALSAQAAVESGWDARLERDPAQKQRFRETFVKYSAWLRSRG